MAEAEQGQRHFRRGIIKMMCLTDKLSPHYSPFDRWRVCSAEGREEGYSTRGDDEQLIISLVG